MGAEPEHGRRRACSRDCCPPNTRAQEREAVGRDVDSALEDVAWLRLIGDNGRRYTLAEVEDHLGC